LADSLLTLSPHVQSTCLLFPSNGLSADSKNFKTQHVIQTEPTMSADGRLSGVTVGLCVNSVSVGLCVNSVSENNCWTASWQNSCWQNWYSIGLQCTQ